MDRDGFEKQLISTALVSDKVNRLCCTFVHDPCSSSQQVPKSSLPVDDVIRHNTDLHLILDTFDIIS